MSQIKTISAIAGISGKLNKKELLTFYTHKNSGKVFAHENRAAGNKPLSEAQIANHSKFNAVHALVKDELENPLTLAQWEAKAKASRKYTTARGICFATLWKTYESAGE